MFAAAAHEKSFVNGEIHHWYRSILGYSDRLVAEFLDEFASEKDAVVLDPFCGAGTTIVECMKRQVKAIGIDANPVSCFATRVKTTWSVNPRSLTSAIERLESENLKLLKRRPTLERDPTYIYMQQSGMLKRGWICERPLLRTLALKSGIRGLRTSAAVKDALMLALLAEFVYGASNIKFGPELYCGPAKGDADVWRGFAGRVEQMVQDLAMVRSFDGPEPTVLLGDSRKAGRLLEEMGAGKATALICSPPYPAEHDYTRNGRLELALLEHVIDGESLREVKRRMIRSHSKGIYKEDKDCRHVKEITRVQRLSATIGSKVKDKKYKFALLYPRVVQEYFGGMAAHLKSVKSVLRSGAVCAYVVGDQSSYMRVKVSTAKILEVIASEIGYESLGIRRWRQRWSTTTSRFINENILLLRRR